MPMQRHAFSGCSLLNFATAPSEISVIIGGALSLVESMVKPSVACSCARHDLRGTEVVPCQAVAPHNIHNIHNRYNAAEKLCTLLLRTSFAYTSDIFQPFRFFSCVRRTTVNDPKLGAALFACEADQPTKHDPARMKGKCVRSSMRGLQSLKTFQTDSRSLRILYIYIIYFYTCTFFSRQCASLSLSLSLCNGS